MEKLSDKNVTPLNSWHEIDWQKVNASVKNLRHRIFVAGLLEPCAGKPARTVLRGRRVSDGPLLPDFNLVLPVKLS